MNRYGRPETPLVIGAPNGAEPEGAVMRAWAFGARVGDVVFVTGDGVDQAVTDGFIELVDAEPVGEAVADAPRHDGEGDAGGQAGDGEPAGSDLAALTKAELVALAKERDVPHGGTKAELIERLGG